MKSIPYVTILILFLVIILQNKSCEPPAPIEPIVKIDTIYVHVRDTITIEKPVYIASKPDTVWRDRPGNIPDSTYEGLLNQYTQLGNAYFTTNVFTSKFPIKDYGYVSITDSIYGNWLMNSTIFTDLNIPSTITTIDKPAPKVNEFYVGGGFTLDKSHPISGIYGGIILKTKNDKLFGVNIGWNNSIQYGLSYYTKLKK